MACSAHRRGDERRGRHLHGPRPEGDTAIELRRLQRHGWRLANEVKIRGDEDIDHLAAGPARVSIVESKWSRHRWLLNDPGSSFMGERLADAVAQALRNTRAAANEFREVPEGVPLRTARVVWSPPAVADDPLWVEHGGAVVVRGPAFARWMQSLDDQALDEQAVTRIWMAVERQAEVRDENDQRRSIPRRRTMSRLALDWLVVPLLSAGVAIYSFVGLAYFGRWWVAIVVLVGYAVVGVAMWRQRVLRPAAIGWMAVVLVFEVGLVVALIRGLIR